MLELTRQSTIINAETAAMAFAGASDRILNQLELGYRSKAHYVSPRLILALTEGRGQDFKIKLDIRKNDVRAIPALGQVASIPFDFEVTRGILESVLEGEILSSVTGQTDVSFASIFSNLTNPQDIVAIDAGSAQQVETLAISDTAKARIAQAISQGKDVVTPTRMVTVNGKPTIAWLEIDRNTGHTISVMEDGGHQVFIEYGLVALEVLDLLFGILPSPEGGDVGEFIGLFQGFGLTNLNFIGHLLGELNNGHPFEEAAKNAKNKAESQMNNLADSLGGSIASGGLVGGFKDGVKKGIEWIKRNVPVDPPVFRFLSSDLGPDPALIPTNPQPGVNVQIARDSFFTESFADAEIPSVYKVQIQNTGNTTNTFNITLPSPPAGYEIQSSVSQITVPPGQTAEVGICLRPINGIGAPGTSVPFSVTVTGTGTSATDTETFVTPDVHGVTLTPDPAFTSASPGSSVPVELAITAASNVAENVTLSTDLPTGVTLNGLPSSVSLAQGETKTFPLTFNVSNGAALNTTLTTTITANVAGLSGDNKPSATIQLSIRSAAVASIEQAAVKAADANHTQLAGVLSQLSDTLGQWQANPGDARLCERAQLQLDNVKSMLAATPILTDLVPQIDRMRNAASSCDVNQTLTIEPTLFTTICDRVALGLDIDLSIALSPNSLVTEPDVPTTANVIVKSRGSIPLTVTLDLTGLPTFVEANLPSGSFTVPAGQTKTIPLTVKPTTDGYFPFQIKANVTELPALHPLAYGVLTSTTAAVNVMSVSASPSFVLRNGSTRIETAIVNNLDVPLPASAVVTIKRPDGTVQYQSPSPTAITIGGNTAFNNFALDAVTATGWADGFYTVELRLLNQNNQPIPGGQGTGKLGVGTPLKASVSADPIPVPPGNSIVATNINIEPKVVGVGGSIGLSPTDPSKDRINWAAASRGTTISGGFGGGGGFTPAKLIDEQGSGDNAFAYTRISLGESFLLNLSTVRSVDTIQFHLRENDINRFFQYRIEASLDGSLFTTIVDKTTGEHRGLQRNVFAATQMRYIKITGTFTNIGDQLEIIDEILAIGDDTVSPVPTQTVTIDGQVNAGTDYLIGQKVSLNAGIYEIKHVGGAVSAWPSDDQNGGRTWEVKINVNVPVVNKTYQLGFVHDAISRFLTANEAEVNSLGKSFTLYLPVHADVFFWFSTQNYSEGQHPPYDQNAADNRGAEMVEVRQLSGPNDSVFVRVRDAMTRSILWEQEEVAAWSRTDSRSKWISEPDFACFGCHVQTQASVGLTESKRKFPDLPLDPALESKLTDAYKEWQSPLGFVRLYSGEIGHSVITKSSLWAWAAAHFSGPLLESLTEPLLRTLDWLLTKQQPEGGWNADDPSGAHLYFDGTPSATHTAGNIQALAKTIDLFGGRSLIPLTDITVDSHHITASKSTGISTDIVFPLTTGVTGVKLRITDTFGSHGNFVLNELEAFEGINKKTFVSGQANFQSFFHPIEESFNGIATNEGEGWNFGRDVRSTPAEGVWVFNEPVTIDRLRVTQIIGEDHHIRDFTIEFTTDAVPTLNGTFTPASITGVGFFGPDRVPTYRAALEKAAELLLSPSWDFRRNVRTAAQTIIGLNAALPQLSGAAAAAARTRMTEADAYLRSIQKPEGGWVEVGNTAPNALYSAQALEALVLVAQSSIDPAILAGTEYLLQAQSGKGSWKAPQGLSRELASTTWVEIALPTVLEHLSGLTIGLDHRVPTTNGVSVVNNSFTPPLASRQSGGGQETLHWDALIGSLNAQNFSFSAQLQGMQPGEVRQISNGTIVNFATVDDQGTLELPPLFVSARHILSISPSTRTVAPGDVAEFTLILENLLGSTETFTWEVNGLPLQAPLAPVTLAAGETKTIPLRLAVPKDALNGTYGFSVVVRGNAGAIDSVEAAVVVEGELSGGGDPPPTVSLDELAVDVALAPASATGGQSTAATFTVRVTNVGNEEDTYTLTGSFPSGFTGEFEEQQVTVLPGLGNYRDVELKVTPPAGASVSAHGFTVRAVSTHDTGVQDDAAGSINVVGQGVDVNITPSTGGPATTFQMTVKNTGQSQDTFDLQLGGPVGVAATLSASSVTLAPGASQTIPITLGSLTFALSGGLDLIGRATSRANTAVKDQDTAQVTIGASKGLSVSITPAVVELPTPGAAAFLVQVNNVGNGEDEYKAEIMGTTGPVTAALSGLNRQPTQMIESFRLPGLSIGGILLNSDLTAPGEGKITVKVTSADGAQTAQAVATVRTPGGSANHPPVVEAGPNQTAKIGQTISLASTFTDEDTGDTHTAMVKWGDGVQTGATVTESNGSGSVVASHSYSQAKSYTVEVCMTDNQEAQSCDTFTVEVSDQSACGECTEPPVVVDNVIELDAAKLAQTAGVLAPFATFDGQTITINLGSRPLVVTSNGRISVPAAPNIQPPAFHNAGNDSSPHLVIRSSCTLQVEETPPKKVKTQTRSLTGVIETVGNGGRGGDITLAFDAGMIINGRVQSVQEKLPDDPRSISGAITLQSQCGPLTIGPSAWVVSWGDKGSGEVTLRQRGEGDVTINGLVMNRMNRQAKGGTHIPTINVEAEGQVVIDGSHLVLDEYTANGTRLDLTSGLLTLSREPEIAGLINVQARGNLTITRDVRALKLNRGNYAAVATIVNAATPQGGDIRLRSLAGSIALRDRAVQANGKRDNTLALIEALADKEVIVASPSVADRDHQPTVTTTATAVNNVGKGGVNVLQACDGQVHVGANAQVLATGKSAPGRNELTADSGTVTIHGTVDPAPVTGAACTDPTPLF